MYKNVLEILIGISLRLIWQGFSSLLYGNLYSMDMLLLLLIGCALSHPDWFTTQVHTCLFHVYLAIVAAVLPWFPHTLWTWPIHPAAHSLILTLAFWKAGAPVRRSGLRVGRCGPRLWLFFFLALVLGPGQGTEPQVMVAT